MKPVRVTIVADVGIDSRANGIAAYLRVFLRYAEGVTCSFWSPQAQEPPPKHQGGSMQGPASRWRRLKKCVPQRIHALRTLWQARRAIARHTDVLFIQESGLAIPFLLGSKWPPIVLVMHGWNPPVIARVRGYKRYLWLRMVDYLAVRKAVRVIMVSDEGLRGFVARYPRQKHKFIHIPTFLDDTFAALVPAEPDHRDDASTGDPVLLCVSRLVPEKRVDKAIEVYAMVRRECPGARLNVVGDGPDRPKLESLARRLGVEQGVRFEGMVAHEDMGRHFSQADIFLLLSKWEGTSIALLEAMAHGLLVVVTDIADHALIVKPETRGLIIPSANQTREAAAWIVKRHRTKADPDSIPRGLEATYLASRQVPHICNILQRTGERTQDNDHHEP